MVDTIATQFSMPIVNEDGYVLMLPGVSSSGEILQWPRPDPYSESAIQLFPLGTRLERGECVWRYCENATADLTIAKPLSSAVSVNAVAADDIVVGTAGTAETNTIVLTSSSSLDDTPADVYGTYNEGYIFVNDGAGQGQCRKIKDCTAFPTSGSATVTTYEDWTITVTAGNGEVGIFQNPFKNVTVCPTAATMVGRCAGVPCIGVTSDYFFWAQTKGPCAVNPKQAISLGTAVIIGTSEGQIDDQSAWTTEQNIGWLLTLAATDGEPCLVFLTIDK